ncbi:nuclear envelope pore membrane protein POM 121 isoform X2 [Melopsittacus undulatus]|uniref:nuclear envelope pore membrane protein POM 121 isoform X2 n=1 Tax=Melopsittacus undulatus TaxID=13146 RepID=UPI00146D28CE|nr:nuclear envelope pore membrane protein POM 121 isoform X2 [Melopsittacus undulatus]
MAVPGPHRARWLLPLAAAVTVALACLVLQGSLLGAALGAAGAWCAMRPGPPASRWPAPHPPARRPYGKAAANGGPAAGAVRVESPVSRRYCLEAPLPTVRRRYPLPPDRSPGTVFLPVRWDSQMPRGSPWARRPAPLRSPVTVKVAGLAHSPALTQQILARNFQDKSSPDPCAKETVLSAIKECRKRPLQQEDNQALGSDHDNKRRRCGGSESGQLAIKTPEANGAPASLVPKPEAMKRDLDSHHSEEYSKSNFSSPSKTYTAGIPGSERNAIASSYSSSRGLPQVKRRCLSVSPQSSTASSCCEMPEWPLKKGREREMRHSKTCTPVKLDKAVQMEEAVERAEQKRQQSPSPPPSPGNGRPRKRSICLLVPWDNEPLVLPPGPDPGYPITEEIIEEERKAAQQRLHRLLGQKEDEVPSTTAEGMPMSGPLACTVTSPWAAPAPAGTSSLPDSLNRTQSSAAAPMLADSTGAAVVSQPLSSAAQLPAPALSLELRSLPATSADTKSVLSTSALTVPGAPSSTAAPAFTELGQTPSKPPSFPKPSILFGTPDTTPSNQLAMNAGTAVPTTTPVFKPIFGESPASCAAVVSTTVTMSVSSGPSSTPSTTTMFKPIFGSVITASSSANTSPFAFQPPLQPASGADLPAASTTTLAGFTGLPNVIFTTAAMTATTESSFTDATIKPVFSFGVNAPTSTGPTTSLTITTATATSMSQPFQFGSPATSAPSTEISFATPGSVLQFGKPTPATVTATTTIPGGPAFGQVPTNLMAPATTAGFSIFGGTTLSSSTPATTSQVTLTFGSPASAFGSCAGAAASQPATSQPAAGPASFASTFSFGAPAAQLAAQPTFGSSAQPAFGPASTQSSFGTSSTQAAFGSTTSVFSFGTATSTTASFGSTTQTTSSSTTGSTIFGTTPSPFTFGVTTQPGPSTSAFGVGTPALSSGSPAAAFSFGAGQSGAALAAAPFGSSLAQSALGAQSQSTPFAFTMPSTPSSKPVFGGTPAPTFGQSTPVPGAVGSGSSSLSFRTPSTPASGFGGVGPSFGSSTPTFSIGAGSKAGARQRLQARRQHTRKK